MLAVCNYLHDNADSFNHDIDFERSPTIPFIGTWSFSDSTSPILYYQWSMGRSFGSNDVAEERIERTPHTRGIALPHTTFESTDPHAPAWIGEAGGVVNQFYFQTVFAFNAAGRFSKCLSDGIKWDDKPPRVKTGRTIQDGLSMDIKTSTSNTTVSANWRGVFYDLESGIDFYVVSLTATAVGAHLVNSSGSVHEQCPWEWNNYGEPLPPGGQMSPRSSVTLPIQPVHVTGQSATLSGLDIMPGQYINVIVTAVDRAGNRHANISNGFMMDNTPPVIERVVDGQTAVETHVCPQYHVCRDGSNDVEVQAGRWVVFFAWQANDPESGIASITVQVATAAGVAVSDEFSVSVADTTAAITPNLADLAHGVQYVSTITATNRAGLRSAMPSSGFMVDFTAPDVAVVAIRGLVGNGTISPHEVLVVRWTCRDLESGCTTFEVGVGGNKGSDTLIPWRVVETPLNATVHETTVDFLGMGLRMKHNFPCVTQCFVDLLALARCLLSSLFAPAQCFNAGCSQTDRDCVCVDYVSVRATNGVGLIRTGFGANALLCDKKPPSTRRVWVNDGLLEDYDFVTIPVAYVRWGGFFDATSGISRHYAELVREQHDGTSVRQEWHRLNVDGTVEPSTSLSVRYQTTLLPGAHYVSIIHALDNAGNRAQLRSNGLRFDPDPPVAGYLRPRQLFQSSLSSLTAQWSGFIDRQSDIKHYLLGWGTTPGASDAIPFRRVEAHGSAEHFHEIAVELTPNQTYFPAITAVNHAGLKTTVSSQIGVGVDTTAAQAQLLSYGFDPLGRNRPHTEPRFQPRGLSFRAVWRVVEDVAVAATDGPMAGVREVELGMGTVRGGSDAVDFRPVSFDARDTELYTTTVFEDSIEGGAYFLTLRTVNEAGLVSTANTGAMIIDSTPADCVHVSAMDTAGAIVDAVSNVDDALCAWSYYDGESGIVEYEVGLTTLPLATVPPDVASFQNVGKRTKYKLSFLNVSLIHGQSYYCIVRATNGAGLQMTHTGHGFVFDSTPATCVVNDGISGDKNYTRVGSSMVASWECTDDESGQPKRYEWTPMQVSSSNGSHFELLTFIPLRHNRVEQELQLEHSGRYISRVTAINRAGLRSTFYSDGFLVDVTPLNPGYLEMMYNATDQRLHARWTFDDFESAVASVQYRFYRLGTTAPRFEFSAGGTSAVTRAINEADHGSMYAIDLLAHNGAGIPYLEQLRSAIDTSPPVATGSINVLVDYLYEPLEGAAETLIALVISWQGTFHDPDSGLFEFLVSTNETMERSYGLERSGLLEIASDPRTICVDVRAVNYATLFTTVTRCVEVHDNSLQPGLIFDGPSNGHDIECTHDLHTVFASWSNFSSANPDEHLTFEWAIGTEPGAVDVQAWRNVRPFLGHYWDHTGAPRWRDVQSTVNRDVQLVSGLRYFVAVRATGRYELGSQQVTCHSDGFVADSTAPIPNLVAESSSQPVWVAQSGVLHQQWSQFSDRVRVWWAILDAETDIANVRVALGTRPGHDDVVEMASNSSTPPHTFDNLELLPGVTYFARVTAFNGAGLSTVLSSPHVLIDITPPVLLDRILDGAGPHDISYQNYTDRFTLSFADQSPHFRDRESGIVLYEVALGTFPGDDDVMQFARQDAASIARTYPLQLQHGQHYFASVRATNAATLSTVVSSDGFVVDITRPVAAPVADVCGEQQHLLMECGTTGPQAAPQNWHIRRAFQHRTTMPCSNVSTLAVAHACMSRISTYTDTVGAVWDDFEDPESVVRKRSTQFCSRLVLRVVFYGCWFKKCCCVSRCIDCRLRSCFRCCSWRHIYTEFHECRCCK